MGDAMPDAATQVAIYRKMALIKLNDERLIAAMKAGKLMMPYYSARGQECIPAAICVQLQHTDYLATIYRGIHDMVSKGVPLRDLWAELAGRATGSCKGKGGPMHITHPQSGCMVTTGVVGSSIPIGAGMALATKLRGEKRVTVANFGDGAANIGAFHEGLNLASVWKLPVIFVCQNNQFAEHTAFSKGTSIGSIAARAASYSMPGERVDGNNPLAVYAAAKTAIERARAGNGPTLIEAVTFRFNGHQIGDAGEYIPKEMYAQAVADDPYPRYRNALIERKCATAAQLDAIDAETRQQIDDAVAFAEASPLADPAELTHDVYARKSA
jgi:acetoin:2,6-dichlorophenolindophenol oxidoreductase subunit alpha